MSTDQTVMMKVIELVEDFTLYPRADVDATHVRQIRMALRSGGTLPEILADHKTKIVIDGIHRKRAYVEEFGPEVEQKVILRRYSNQRDMFLDAMRMNSSHGRNLSPYDRAHAALRAKALRISSTKVANALNLTTDALEKLCRTKSAMVSSISKKGGAVTAIDIVPIKRTIAHMAGEALTPSQFAAHEKLQGMPALVFVNQLIILFENDLIDFENGSLVDRLHVLSELLAKDKRLGAKRTKAAARGRKSA